MARTCCTGWAMTTCGSVGAATATAATGAAAEATGWTGGGGLALMTRTTASGLRIMIIQLSAPPLSGSTPLATCPARTPFLCSVIVPCAQLSSRRSTVPGEALPIFSWPSDPCAPLGWSWSVGNEASQRKLRVALEVPAAVLSQVAPLTGYHPQPRRE